MSTYRKLYYEINKEKEQQQRKNRYEQNKEKELEYSRQYRSNNVSSIKLYSKKYNSKPDIKERRNQNDKCLENKIKNNFRNPLMESGGA